MIKSPGSSNLSSQKISNSYSLSWRKVSKWYLKNRGDHLDLWYLFLFFDKFKSLISDLLLGFFIFYGWKSSPIYCRKKMLKIQAQGVVRILWMEFIANRLFDVGRQRCLCSILLHTVRMLAHQFAKVSSNSWSRSQLNTLN